MSSYMAKNPVLITVFALLLIGFGATAVSAQGAEGKPPSDNAEQKVVIQNDEAPPAAEPAPLEDFIYSLPSEEGAYCFGSCNCFICECTGTETCCAAGCDACFDKACRMTTL